MGKWLRAFLYIAVFLLMFSCVGYVKNKNFIIWQPEEIAEEYVPSAELSEQEILFLTIDSIVSDAKIYALDGNFSEAQCLMNEIFEMLSEQKKSINKTESLIRRIVGLYIDKMPLNFIDSMDVSIRPFVFDYRLERFMGKIDTTDMDMEQFPADCIRDILFDLNIPITYNKRVEEAMTFFRSAGRVRRNNTELNRAMYFRPFMVEMYSKAGLPTDMTYLPLIESAFDPKAYSSASASGLWQFISSTGQIYGLRENYWVDERRDPIKSTAASIAYFRVLYDIFGDWYLALAAYNFGEPRVLARLERAVEINPDTLVSYWDLQLPQETMRYVPLFIAYKIIAKNPECFGFFPDTSIVPFPYDTVKVSSFLDMRKIARGIGIRADSLIKINPHIKHTHTPPDMKNVNLYIPVGKKAAFRRFYSRLKPEDKKPVYDYTIAEGDSISGIAEMFGTTVQAIKEKNEMESDSLDNKKTLTIPLPSAEPPLRAYRYRVAEGDNINRVARRFNTTVDEIRDMNSMRNHSLLAPGGYILIPLPEDEAAARRIINRIRTDERTRLAAAEKARNAADIVSTK